MKTISAELMKKVLMQAKTESVLVMDDVAPQFIAEWLSLLAVCHDTQPSILLAVILTCIVVLLGSTTVEVKTLPKNKVINT